MTRLSGGNQVICVENLDIVGMIAGSHSERSKSIHDAAWGMFLRELAAHTGLAGRELVVAPKFFPGTQTCAVCGTWGKKKSLDVRVWTCTACGTVLDRDYNAATNHLKLARGSAESLHACGVTLAQLAGVGDESGTTPCAEEAA
ncbi:transposase [Microbacterium hominis]|uniref:Transposase n=1 Tax=Microbacterium hominis TaxID=162426 RepID=A0A7D4UIM1_9MICO|nr:transposase [Microbacterium hominis]